MRKRSPTNAELCIFQEILLLEVQALKLRTDFMQARFGFTHGILDGVTSEQIQKSIDKNLEGEAKSSLRVHGDTFDLPQPDLIKAVRSQFKFDEAQTPNPVVVICMAAIQEMLLIALPRLRHNYSIQPTMADNHIIQGYFGDMVSYTQEFLGLESNHRFYRVFSDFVNQKDFPFAKRDDLVPEFAQYIFKNSFRFAVKLLAEKDGYQQIIDLTQLDALSTTIDMEVGSLGELFQRCVDSHDKQFLRNLIDNLGEQKKLTDSLALLVNRGTSEEKKGEIESYYQSDEPFQSGDLARKISENLDDKIEAGIIESVRRTLRFAREHVARLQKFNLNDVKSIDLTDKQIKQIKEILVEFAKSSKKASQKSDAGPSSSSPTPSLEALLSVATEFNSLIETQPLLSLYYTLSIDYAAWYDQYAPFKNISKQLDQLHELVKSYVAECLSLSFVQRKNKLDEIVRTINKFYFIVYVSRGQKQVVAGEELANLPKDILLDLRPFVQNERMALNLLSGLSNVPNVKMAVAAQDPPLLAIEERLVKRLQDQGALGLNSVCDIKKNALYVKKVYTALGKVKEELHAFLKTKYGVGEGVTFKSLTASKKSKPRIFRAFLAIETINSLQAAHDANQTEVKDYINVAALLKAIAAEDKKKPGLFNKPHIANQIAKGFGYKDYKEYLYVQRLCSHVFRRNEKKVLSKKIKSLKIKKSKLKPNSNKHGKIERNLQNMKVKLDWNKQVEEGVKIGSKAVLHALPRPYDVVPLRSYGLKEAGRVESPSKNGTLRSEQFSDRFSRRLFKASNELKTVRKKGRYRISRWFRGDLRSEKLLHSVESKYCLSEKDLEQEWLYRAMNAITAVKSDAKKLAVTVNSLIDELQPTQFSKQFINTSTQSLLMAERVQRFILSELGAISGTDEDGLFMLEEQVFQVAGDLKHRIQPPGIYTSSNAPRVLQVGDSGTFIDKYRALIEELSNHDAQTIAGVDLRTMLFRAVNAGGKLASAIEERQCRLPVKVAPVAIVEPVPSRLTSKANSNQPQLTTSDALEFQKGDREAVPVLAGRRSPSPTPKSPVGEARDSRDKTAKDIIEKIMISINDQYNNRDIAIDIADVKKLFIIAVEAALGAVGRPVSDYSTEIDNAANKLEGAINAFEERSASSDGSDSEGSRDKRSAENLPKAGVFAQSFGGKGTPTPAVSQEPIVVNAPGSSAG